MGGSLVLALCAGLISRGAAAKAWVESHPKASLPIAIGLWLAVVWSLLPSRV